MWQLFAAAVAASTGLLAEKHIFFEPPPFPITMRSLPVQTPTTPPPGGRLLGLPQADPVFRFSSEAASGRGRRVDAEVERSNGVEQRRTARRGVGVCLKKRKTGKNVDAAKCGSSCSKAEINKLNTAMDETARFVQELQSELHKRKSPHSASFSNKLSQPELNNPSTEDRGAIHMQMSSFTVSEDAGCASSVLTEEQDPHSEVMDMDQLEAELESELQKLPWCAMDTPRHEGLSNLGQDIVSEVTAQGFHDLEGQCFVTQEFHGVLPAQLDQKLCHLESELHSAQSKLQHKETELETLKDRVRRLTELSIGNVSDDENGTSIGQEQTTNWNHNMEGCESTKPTVGMKRPIDSES
ncbi:unnamed protein product [Malus baccata var. baccata]